VQSIIIMESGGGTEIGKLFYI